MVNKIKSTALLLLLLSGLATSSLLAQETEGEEESEKEEGRHRVAIMMGHAYVPEGIDIDGIKRWLVLPGWGLDYDYRFADRWAVGIHTDFIVESFELEEHFGKESAVLKRSRPLAAAIVVSYKPGRHVTYLIGGGGEFAAEENLGLIRLGVEYGWELPEEWEIGVSLMNDFKINAYNSWLFGLGVSKFF